MEWTRQSGEPSGQGQTPPARRAPAAPGERLAAAMAQHRAGELAAAESAYGALLAEFPDDADARHFLGMLRFQLGASAEALALLQGALAIAPDNSHAWNNLGNMLMHLERHEEAEQAYRRATALGAAIAPAWYNLAILHARRREFARALACLREATRLSRGFVNALQMLAAVYYRLDRPDEARDIYQQWAEEAPDDPRPRHMLAATSGRDVPERAAEEFIVSTFDRFAKSFDEMLARLEYRAPQLIAASLIQHPLYQSGRAVVLDAGCGTGWCGPLVKSTAAQLIGVDLSTNMVEQARNRGVYDELHVGELTAFMQAHPAAFDIIVAADVLCYFGTLVEFARAARAALREGGLLSFTVEALAAPAPGEEFRLQMHGRYAHGRGYLERVLAVEGFAAAQIDPVVLRLEFRQPVHGYLVAATGA
jgi:predicted TPR repeat methyltransferase